MVENTTTISNFDFNFISTQMIGELIKKMIALYIHKDS
jgi:hypothetical protein